LAFAYPLGAALGLLRDVAEGFTWAQLIFP